MITLKLTAMPQMAAIIKMSMQEYDMCLNITKRQEQLVLV
jgi:hypothetical protein